MSVQGIILIDVVSLLLLAAIVNLVRTQRLHAGFGILWIGAVLALMTMVSFPPLLAWITRLVGAVFPASALTLLAFVFIFAVLVFFSVRISSLSAQHAELVQAIALRDLRAREKAAGRGRSAEGNAEPSVGESGERPGPALPPSGSSPAG